ncbi:hypothetical protein [Robinsoniella peoriensis]|uniref:hypothetical protein n=1 Tax=Robinsoniella peoriensis TaxID=180332 RepID=UPI0005C7D2BB|nr:hypothetical protein [Robinsoniella peoriensis]
MKEMKCTDNKNGKVKSTGKVIGGICGVVVLAGVTVTAFAAGQKETAGCEGASRINKISAVSEVSGVRDISAVNEISAVSAASAVSEASSDRSADTYWMKDMSVFGSNVTDIAETYACESAMEDGKRDDSQEKALKKSFDEVNSEFLKLKADLEKKEADRKTLLGKEKDWSNPGFQSELDSLEESMHDICDKLSTVQDDAYYNLDALVYGSENYDVNYQKWDSVFEAAASLQRRYFLQLSHIYQKITDKTTEIYEKYGLKRDEKEHEYYYNGKKVRYFEDGVWEGQSFSGSMSSGNDGEVDVFALRDKNGDLTGFEVCDIDNTKERVNEYYRSKENFNFEGSANAAQESAF